MLKEITSYYNANNSAVYFCMLDGSKAYDRVNFGKLFTILVEKNIPAFTIRYLLNEYKNQQLRAEWIGHFPKSFQSYNCVQQGSVLSPILFNLI